MSKEKKTPVASSAKKTSAKKTSSTTTKKSTISEKKPATAKKASEKKSTTTSAKKQADTSKKPTTTKKPVAKKATTTPTKKPVKEVVKKATIGKSEKEGPLDKYLHAGEIAIKVKELLRKKAKVGASVLEICEAGEAKIVELGGKWAFPLNVSINNIAAHYSAAPDDELVIQSGDLVKLDCGVHVEGYVADTAFTVSFGSDHADIIKASEEATKAAIDMIRPGISTERLGEEIEEIIRSYGYRSIRDLTGHQLEQNLLHGQITIPNIKGVKGHKLEAGQVFAIETFASSGTGNIHPDESKCLIYQLIPFQVGLRLESSRKARKIILSDYKDFPFTTRWIAKELTAPIARLALNDLSTKGQIKRYPALCDVKGSIVSQSEHTVFLTENSRVVTTLSNQ
ncbi:MAG TPA: type II methionyl aminopeptidase [candidate division Zixibacteria bacterium]|nr:type II methionyl aminopeptidase [candidate division Zixibacteria bacterium]